MRRWWLCSGDEFFHGRDVDGEEGFHEGMVEGASSK